MGKGKTVSIPLALRMITCDDILLGETGRSLMKQTQINDYLAW